MKIIRLDHADDASGAPLRTTLMADSCWRPDMRPLFVPDGPEWVCEVRMAIHVGRLGKAIRAKFAGRYLDSWAAVNYLRPASADALDATTAATLDESLIHGEWHPLDGPVTLAMGTENAIWQPPLQLMADKIERLSALTTFKTGDVLVLPDAIFTYTPARDVPILVTADTEPCLRFNLK